MRPRIEHVGLDHDQHSDPAHPIEVRVANCTCASSSGQVNFDVAELQLAGGCPAERVVLGRRCVKQPAAVGLEHLDPRRAAVGHEQPDERAVWRPPWTRKRAVVGLDRAPAAERDSTRRAPSGELAGNTQSPSAAVTARRRPSGDHAGSQAPSPARTRRRLAGSPAQTAVPRTFLGPCWTAGSPVSAQSATLDPNRS